MNTLYQYIQSENVIRAYLNKLISIWDCREYQHFISRLRLIKDYQTQFLNSKDSKKFFSNVYEPTYKELEWMLDSTPSKVFDEIIKRDTNGYLNDLKQKNDSSIKRYLYITYIADYYNILRRNERPITGKLKQRVYDLLDDSTIDFMCKTSKNDFLREHEGTLCVNGIGYLLYLWGNDTKTKIKEAFIDLYKYYLKQVYENGLINRNFVYGLTHCVIDVSDFYTRDVNDQIMMFQKTYPIGELYDQTATVIGKCLGEYTKVGSTPSLDSLSSDMLAELLVTYKLLLDDYPSNKFYDFGYTISRVYNELVDRIDPVYGYIRDHKEENLALDLKKNEHTNILFILYSRL